jgi:perosamine synthetase
MMRLNLPLLDKSELDEVAEVLKSGYLTQGPKVAKFEELCLEFLKCKYAFATSSCTTALHLALVALGIGAGDEVLVPDFTFPASANVVVQTGAKPVLVDIDLDTFTINYDDLVAKTTARTKAIMPVHAFGCSADMTPIIEFAKKNGLKIIEDAACAFGTTYYGNNCGTLGDIGCFSFHPRKAITTGEGGLITTNDENLAEKISVLRNHGGHKIGFWFQYDEAGFNYRLSDIQGAVGIAQMRKLPTILKEKKERAFQLSEKLIDIPKIKIPSEPVWGGHVYQSYVIMVDETINRDQIISEMRKKNIETTIGTYALHDQPFFQRQYGYKSGDIKNSHAAFNRSVTLPLYPQLTKNDLDLIRNSLQNSIQIQL